MLVACVNKVDLPMPGSPPTRSTEPRTKPPPVTRSSSVMPEDRRGASLLFPVSDSSANVRPRRFERIDTGTLPVVSSSASVFHSPQASHLPCQRLYAAPQFWQTKESADLAMGCGIAVQEDCVAFHSMDTPAASMMASITSRNTSGSSLSTNRLAMNAPDISE